MELSVCITEHITSLDYIYQRLLATQRGVAVCGIMPRHIRILICYIHIYTHTHTQEEVWLQGIRAEDTGVLHCRGAARVPGHPACPLIREQHAGTRALLRGASAQRDQGPEGEVHRPGELAGE